MSSSIFESGLLTRQVVLGTGGGSGTGCCTAHELARLSAQAGLPDAKSPQRPAAFHRAGLSRVLQAAADSTEAS